MSAARASEQIQQWVNGIDSDSTDKGSDDGDGMNGESDGEIEDCVEEQSDHTDSEDNLSSADEEQNSENGKYLSCDKKIEWQVTPPSSARGQGSMSSVILIV